jgi:phosphoadenosine phosphosulfate reductase
VRTAEEVLRIAVDRFQASVTMATGFGVEGLVLIGLVKLNPLLEWSLEDVWRYARERDVPVNPLHQRGYPSIGCVPCTTPVGEGEEARAGRWRGREKKECGLHDRPRGAR